jgi:hypothetical protein
MKTNDQDVLLLEERILINFKTETEGYHLELNPTMHKNSAADAETELYNHFTS